MKLPVLYSDMDQTMVYSSKALSKHQQTVLGTVCVEVHHNDPVSFTGMKSLELLQRNAGKNLHFIPVTTRTFRQFNRISFPGVRIKHAVVLNGARIIVDGEEDYKWTKKVAAEVKTLDTSPTSLWEKLVHDLTGNEEVHGIHNAEGFFPYLVTNTAYSPDVDKYTRKIAEQTGYIRSKQGRKTYLVPPLLSKGAAVAELNLRVKSTFKYAAGDSLLDFTMHPEVNLFLQPAHGDKYDTSETFIRTKAVGLGATEEILQHVTNHL